MIGFIGKNVSLQSHKIRLAESDERFQCRIYHCCLTVNKNLLKKKKNTTTAQSICPFLHRDINFMYNEHSESKNKRH